MGATYRRVVRCGAWLLAAMLLLACGDGATGDETSYPVGTEIRSLFDRTRDRTVNIRYYFPLGSTGVHAVVLVSNGKIGEPAGEDELAHLGQRLAERGMVAITVGHLPSTALLLHREDRPQDVSFVLDSLEDGSLDLPGTFDGSVDPMFVGHTGHSAGAYTTHALAGATYPYGVFADPRIAAAVPISPQGTGDFFEAFDNGPDDNTWVTVQTPIMMLVGGEEIAVNGIGLPQPEGWRLEPWDNYADTLDRHKILVPGQDHRQMGNFGEPEIQDYLAETVADFFAVYLVGDESGCAIGNDRVPAGTIPEVSRAAGTTQTQLAGCR